MIRGAWLSSFHLDPWGGTACVGWRRSGPHAGERRGRRRSGRPPPTGGDGLMGERLSFGFGPATFGSRLAMRVHVATALPFYASRGAWRRDRRRVQGVNSGV